MLLSKNKCQYRFTSSSILMFRIKKNIVKHDSFEEKKLQSQTLPIGPGPYGKLSIIDIFKMIVKRVSINAFCHAQYLTRITLNMQ